MKKFRTDVKNQWTFPLFYGSWYGSVARNTNIPDTIIKPLVEDFWQKYNGVKRWQESTIQFYKENGYLKSLTGFRFRAPLETTEIINYIIQSTASDIVVDAMNRLSEMAERDNKPQLQPVLNIHDDVTFFLPDDTIEEDLQTILHEMVNVPFDFINVPMLVEPAIGKDWFAIEPIGDFYTGQI
jgi:DNA polymerase-1